MPAWGWHADDATYGSLGVGSSESPTKSTDRRHILLGAREAGEVGVAGARSTLAVAIGFRVADTARRMSVSPIEVIPRHAQRFVPWKNGGGRTREVASAPDGCDGFRWRVSVAEVASDGPFSAFPGIDRTIWLLRGAGLDLRVGDRSVRLDRVAEPFSFTGEDRVFARLIDGPTEDLNVMVKRAAVLADARVTRIDGGLDVAPTSNARDVLVLVLVGECELRVGDGSGVRLLCGDAAVLRGRRDAVFLRSAASSVTVLLAEFQSIVRRE